VAHQEVLFALTVDTGERDVLDDVFEILKYVIDRHFSVCLHLRDERVAVVDVSETQFSSFFLAEIRAYCQNLLTLVVSSMGWNVKVHRPYGKRIVAINHVAYSHFRLRRLSTDLVDGTCVRLTLPDGSVETELWVGGPFHRRLDVSRAFAYGQIIGFVNYGGGIAYATINEGASRPRVFQLASEDTLRSLVGKWVFVSLERFRGGGRRCWRALEIYEVHWPLF
jgi:hypothetical protein